MVFSQSINTDSLKQVYHDRRPCPQVHVFIPKSDRLIWLSANSDKSIVFPAVGTRVYTCLFQHQISSLGSLSRDVFERPTSTGSELFSLLVCLDANKFVLLSFFSPLKTIYSRVSTKPLPNDAKSSLPVDVRRSKTLLLKLPNYWSAGTAAGQRYNEWIRSA